MKQFLISFCLPPNQTPITKTLSFKESEVIIKKKVKKHNWHLSV